MPVSFREAFEREVQNQGLSVAEIADASGISRGAIYNILNGKTEEARIRPATRRALARGCGRDIEVEADGSTCFVEAGRAPVPALTASQSLEIRFVPDRPFLDDALFRDPFDWIHQLEEAGSLAGVGVVDRVFQGREEFLSMEVVNRGMEEVQELSFEMSVRYEDGPSNLFSHRMPVALGHGDALEQTVYLMAGPACSLELRNIAYVDDAGDAHALAERVGLHFEGRPS